MDFEIQLLEVTNWSSYLVDATIGCAPSRLVECLVVALALVESV